MGAIPFTHYFMVIIIIGVTGSGKTTIGKLLARELGWKFYDADDFHPSTSTEKMSRGLPLDDQDRMPWLWAIRDLITSLIERKENAVIACSALKSAYRKILCVGRDVVFVYLKADISLIEERVKRRRGHFMNPALLQSQFDILEEPKKSLHVNAALTPAEIVQQIRSRLAV